MPCWQTRAVEVDMKKANKPVLKAALESIGLAVTETSTGLIAREGRWGDPAVEWSNGVLKVWGTKKTWQVNGQPIGSSVEAVQKAYTLQSIKETQRLYPSWKMTQTKENQVVLRKGF